MTAEVEILIAHLKDALTLPVAAIVEQRGEYNCWVKEGDKIERRPLVLGLSNDQFVEIKDGVSEGDEVLLNPRAVVREARSGDTVEKKVDVSKRFGEQSTAGPAAGQGPGEGKPAGAQRAAPMRSRSRPGRRWTPWPRRSHGWWSDGRTRRTRRRSRRRRTTEPDGQ